MVMGGCRIDGIIVASTSTVSTRQHARNDAKRSPAHGFGSLEPMRAGVCTFTQSCRRTGSDVFGNELRDYHRGRRRPCQSNVGALRLPQPEACGDVGGKVALPDRCDSLGGSVVERSTLRTCAPNDLLCHLSHGAPGATAIDRPLDHVRRVVVWRGQRRSWEATVTGERSGSCKQQQHWRWRWRWCLGSSCAVDICRYRGYAQRGWYAYARKPSLAVFIHGHSIAASPERATG